LDSPYSRALRSDQETADTYGSGRVPPPTRQPSLRLVLAMDRHQETASARAASACAASQTRQACSLHLRLPRGAERACPLLDALLADTGLSVIWWDDAFPG